MSDTDQYHSALDRLTAFMKEARSHGLDGKAAVLATADRNGHPSARVISVLAVEPEGLLFFANTKSGKARQMTENPHASLCFYWQALKVQAVVEGRVEAQSREVSDEYWYRRSRDSQLAAWASDQGETVSEKDNIKTRRKYFKHLFNFDPVERHANWQAFRLVPERIEFWHGGWESLRERTRYRQQENGWDVERLGP